MKVTNLLTIRKTRDLVDLAVVARLHLVRILNDFVNEVAEMKHELELLGRRSPLILENHSAVSVELAFIDALAADEGEVDRTLIVGCWRRGRAPNAASIAL